MNPAMKRCVIYTLALCASLWILASCSRAQSPNNLDKFGPGKSIKTDFLKGKKILIVYLSRTKNTKAVAEMIQKEVGGDLVALELLKPYPENYQQTVAQVARENETGYLPPLTTRIDDIRQYDLIFLGFPTWGMKLPPPMKSFLNAYDLGSKIVIPFNTNAGYGIGSSFETLKKLCPKSKHLEGFSTKGGVERDGVLFVMNSDRAVTVQQELRRWLIKIGLIKE